MATAPAAAADGAAAAEPVPDADAAADELEKPASWGAICRLGTYVRSSCTRCRPAANVVLPGQAACAPACACHIARHPLVPLIHALPALTSPTDLPSRLWCCPPCTCGPAEHQRQREPQHRQEHRPRCCLVRVVVDCMHVPCLRAMRGACTSTAACMPLRVPEMARALFPLLRMDVCMASGINTEVESLTSTRGAGQTPSPPARNEYPPLAPSRAYGTCQQLMVPDTEPASLPTCVRMRAVVLPTTCLCNCVANISRQQAARPTSAFLGS